MKRQHLKTTIRIFYNVCSAEKYTKHNNVLILHFVYFSAEQTLDQTELHLSKQNLIKGHWGRIMDFFSSSG